MEFATRVTSSVIHGGLDSPVNWTSVHMSAVPLGSLTQCSKLITAHLITSAPESSWIYVIPNRRGFFSVDSRMEGTDPAVAPG
jgi:hypothetical protein